MGEIATEVEAGIITSTERVNHTSNGSRSQLLAAPAGDGTMTTTNGTVQQQRVNKRCLWFEEELEPDLRWVFGVSKILHTGESEFQTIELVESGPFGKVLLLDGKLQSAEADEFVYHESIVHPALLYHSNPKKVFIMGGGEGSTAREVLKHSSVKKVVMCDIDQEVVDFCRSNLIENAEAFSSTRVELVINDARAELENRNEKFDVIIGDLNDPVEGGPCFTLYTHSFYLHVIKLKLNVGGILVTQAGPAGILSHTEVYSSIYNTLRQTFKCWNLELYPCILFMQYFISTLSLIFFPVCSSKQLIGVDYIIWVFCGNLNYPLCSYAADVLPYAAHVPSYADTWGWVMASDQAFPTINIKETDYRIQKRIQGDLHFLDGQTLCATLALNKHVRKTLAEETHVYTEDSARFIHGYSSGLKNQN